MHLRIRRPRHEAATSAVVPPRHAMTSQFDTAICRFTLDCTCGAHYDTRYIDKALELRELHTTMAPLIDALEG